MSDRDLIVPGGTIRSLVHRGDRYLRELDLLDLIARAQEQNENEGAVAILALVAEAIRRTR